MISLKYYGLSCFEFKTPNCTIVSDPFDTDKVGVSRKKINGDVVITSKNHRDLLVDPKEIELTEEREKAGKSIITIEEPGEYEVGGVFIRTFKNPFYHEITLGDLNVCYLGMLGAHKSQEDLEGIGQIDYLIVPVGDEGSFVPWKILKKLIKKIDPSYVVPCCYKEKGLSDELGEIKTLDDFVSEFGVGKVQEKTTLKMSSVSRSDEDEQYKIVTLKRR